MRSSKTLIIFVIAIIILTVSALYPLETAFLTFPSPEDAFAYNNIGKIELMIEGKESAFVIAHNGDKNTPRIIPKEGDRWKASIGLDTKTISQKIVNGMVIYVYRYRSTSEYYVSVLNTNGGEITISDDKSTNFQHAKNKNAALGETFYTYYAYIQDLSSGYVMTIDGQAIVL